MIRSLINLSALSAEPTAAPVLENMSDTAMFALQNSVLGILIVFSVLALLFIIVKIAGNILCGAKEKKKEESATPPTSAPASVPTPAPAPAPVADDGEIVAAITAAISLMLEAEGKDPRGFRVVSFRRSSTRK